jgi:hypothetical protein
MTAIDTDPETFDIDAAIEAVGDGLNAQGLDVRTFASDNCRHLKVDNVRSTVADLFIYPKGTVNWDYHSFDGTTHDPSRVTTITLAILADPGTPDSATVVRYPQMSFLGSVGRATIERGLSATFSSRDPDNARFKIHDEVAITNPARPRRGTVQVTNDGALWWTCQLRSQPHSQDGLDLVEITNSIARALINSLTPQRLPATGQSQDPAA